jgi:hypothetical protein
MTNEERHVAYLMSGMSVEAQRSYLMLCRGLYLSDFTRGKTKLELRSGVVDVLELVRLINNHLEADEACREQVNKERVANDGTR